MDNYLKITVPFLLITVAALYGIRRRKLAGNRMNSCKGPEMGSSQKQVRQAPESENEMGSEEDEILNEVHKQPSCKGLLFWSVLSFRFLVKDDNSNFMKAVPHLLKSFPLLKKLDIQFSPWPAGKMYEVPIPYLHDNLKEVKLSLFQEQWIPVAIFLLQSAVGLNCMMLTKSSRRYYCFEHSYMREDKLSEIECEIIRKALIGKASSPQAQIIIEELVSSGRTGHGSGRYEGLLGTTLVESAIGMARSWVMGRA